MKTDLFNEVIVLAQKIDSKYRDVCTCRDDLVGFFDINDWFGMTYEWKDGRIFIERYHEIEDRIALWLKAYMKTDSERFFVLFNEYEKIYPVTCRNYRKYALEKNILNKPSSWKIMDFLFSEIECEVCEITEAESEMLFSKASLYLPIVSTEYLIDFVNREQSNIGVMYEVESRKKVDFSNDAYTFNSFSIMAYCTFNDEYWRKNNLISKALEKKKYSDLWLFMSFHFIGALRRTDMMRLPVPELPYDKEIIKERLLEGKFQDEDALSIAEDFRIRLKYLPFEPNKTSKYSGIPEIKLFIPTSLRVPLGIIMAIALLHHEEGTPLVAPVHDLRTIRNFYGKTFSEALENRRFSTRKANKAYLQGIERFSENEVGRPKGYMLAALARSHKGGIGTLPEITDVYLNDAAFSGYSSEFILREMFERGIMGFVPAMLLEKYTGANYTKLAISEQTRVIKELGLSAYQIENITLAVRKAEEKAISIVESFSKESVAQIIVNIASGASPAKQDEMLCARIAAGYKCQHPERTSCLGCGYEIYTKAAFHIIMKEYVRIMRLKKENTGFEKERYKKILELGIVPIIAEIVESIPRLYPGTKMNFILDMLERGMTYADQING